MTRVLISQFDTIVGIGVRAVLTDGGCEVLESLRQVTKAVVEMQPDALVIDMDDVSASAASVQLVQQSKRLALVLCSSARPEMRIYPRGGLAAYDAPPSPELLVRAVTAA